MATNPQSRLLILLGAAAVGALFAAGLFVHGRVGGGLLLITDAILVALTRLNWSRARPEGRPLRIAVILLVGVLAILKLAGAVG